MKAAQLGMTDFRASAGWAWSILTEMGYGSRKVSRLVTYRQLANDEAMAQERAAFVQQVRQDIAESGFNLHQVLNIDQSGVKYCFPSNRTLEKKGTRVVLCGVKDVQKTKSSFSVLQSISAAGTHVGPVCICFQETDGCFGPIVTQQIGEIASRHPDVLIKCSRSGMFNPVLMEQYLQELREAVDCPALLLLDQWGGQKSPDLWNEVGFHDLNPHFIPAKATDEMQPLDIVYFLQFKKIIRRTWRHIESHGIDWKALGIKERELEVRLVFLAVNQLKASTFMPMIRYAFRKPGYVDPVDSVTDIFPKIKDVCYNFKTFKGPCVGSGGLACNEIFCIVCAHCQSPLCFNHFLVQKHCHTW